ncbi:MAG: hypothetical protein V4750_02840 [Pseudomonadota bacterium]
MTKKPAGCVDFKLYLRVEVDERFRRQCKRVAMKRSPLLAALVEEWTIEMEAIEAADAESVD